jgi:hypothetical protein
MKGKLKIILTILFFVNGIMFSGAQSIPAFSGSTAENKNINIPASCKGKFALICFASSKKAQSDLESWLDPVYNHYIAKTGFMDDMFDVDVYFIPVFSGAEGAMTASIKRKFMENSQKDLWPHVLFCEKGLKETLSSLKMDREDIPYFFLLDKVGGIAYRTSGPYTEEKFDAIDELISE